ncbi:Protein-lysine N-methyltransferase efm5 [Saitoella coloradoensis]
MSGFDDEELFLSASSLAALQSFLVEQQAQKDKFDELEKKAQERFDATRAAEEEDEDEVTMELFKEDWQLSQFWYSNETSEWLSRRLLHNATNDTKIAVLSAPSAFAKLRTMFPPSLPNLKKNTYLLEYDPRFAVFGSQFLKYDFNEPTKLPAHLKHTFDIILLDPPFLSEECHLKSAMTARWLLKNDGSGQAIICTGAKMLEFVPRLYKNCKVTTYRPAHSGGLANDFRCFSTFETKEMKWEEE